MRESGKRTAAFLLIAGLGGFPLTACTAGLSGAAPPSSAGATAAAAPDTPAGNPGAGAATSHESGTDVGNGRPASTYDGLMVRRRVVVAVHHSEGADLGSIHQRLGGTAAGRGVELSEISPDVLGPATLEHMVPEVIVALPDKSTTAEAEALAAAAFGPEGSFAGVKHVHVASVLVHDLRFTMAVADPAATEAEIDNEGIASDALGNYVMDVDAGSLSINYTGPILSDALVESVRAGMGRSAGVGADAVEVGPRSPGGVGVILANEPPPPPATDGAGGHDDTRPGTGPSPGEDAGHGHGGEGADDSGH